MSLSMQYINQNGLTRCCVCKEKKEVSQVELCMHCDRFACKTCSKLVKNKYQYGYVCKTCASKLQL